MDMEQQVLANSIRIRVLEQENVTLHNSLVKLKERAQQNAAEVKQVNVKTAVILQPVYGVITFVVSLYDCEPIII